MSKKYDNNLQEIKETGTFATNTTIDSRNLGTLGVYFERDVLTKKVEELQQQLAEKDKKIRELKEELEDETDFKNEYYKYWQDLKEEMLQKCKEIGQLEFNLAKKRHQICNEIKKRIVKETCYDTEEEVRNAIYDFNAREVLKILDDIEKGE